MCAEYQTTTIRIIERLEPSGSIRARTEANAVVLIYRAKPGRRRVWKSIEQRRFELIDARIPETMT